MEDKSYSLAKVQRMAGTPWQMANEMERAIIIEHVQFYFNVFCLLALAAITGRAENRQNIVLGVIACMGLLSLEIWLYGTLKKTFKMLVMALMIAEEDISEWKYIFIRNREVIVSKKRSWRVHFSIKRLKKQIENNVEKKLN